MLKLDNHLSGRHFLHIPGPSPVPSRVLRSISYQTIDHRGPEFGVMGLEVIAGIKKIFQTEQPVIIYSASGTGAWEGAMVNVLKPGDHVLFYETGQFANLWRALAQRLGLHVEVVGKVGQDTWRWGVDASVIEARLLKDTQHEIKAVCVVHNETSTGVTSNIAAVRQVIDAAKHPALLIVDSVSGIGAADYRHDEWGVDVTVSGSQKGLMLPPGLGFNALSERAIEVSEANKNPRSYWAWDDILESNKTGYWPTTPSTNLLYGLHEALDMMQAEGLETIFARHQRLATACRLAVDAWGLENQSLDKDCYSPILTCVAVPEGIDADKLRKHAQEKFNLSLGTGLGKIKGKAFRIGHLGDCNELSLMAALCGVEMSLGSMGFKPKASGVVAAQAFLA
jgi:alanine-glyoxylate transaminase/serine-glyoxylate transaminase/serine-pyruvate transaminase